MLADDIIAQAGTRTDVLLMRAFTRIARIIAQAQRFDFSTEAILSAETIAVSPLDSQLRALTLCRLPFKLTWFEWPTHGLYLPTLKRMGVLLEASDDSLQRGFMSFAFHHPMSGFSIGIAGYQFDWSDSIPIPPPPFPSCRTEDEEDIDWHARYGDLRIKTDTSEYMRPWIDHGQHSADQIRKFAEIASKQITGLEPLVRAALLLLNSRNLIASEHRPASTALNKARGAKGQTPLHDYTHIRINLSRAIAGRSGEAANPRNPTRLHLVRGHFKVRATGIYWWSPFARGDVEQGRVIRQRREVSG